MITTVIVVCLLILFLDWLQRLSAKVKDKFRKKDLDEPEG